VAGICCPVNRQTIRSEAGIFPYHLVPVVAVEPSFSAPMTFDQRDCRRLIGHLEALIGHLIGHEGRLKMLGNKAK
jgi:hypothetical protein